MLHRMLLTVQDLQLRTPYVTSATGHGMPHGMPHGMLHAVPHAVLAHVLNGILPCVLVMALPNRGAW